MNKLEALKQKTIVVADTGDIESIRRLNPQDATTNPSLLFKAAQLPQYTDLLQSCIKKSGQLNEICAHFAVAVGREILNIVPGLVSTEVDARASFDTKMTIRMAENLVKVYEASEVDPKRILIKIAATWEGIQAARQLEKYGIRTNLTLVFHLNQAKAAADAGAYLISPFVGRISDWFQKNQAHETPTIDPGVASVARIHAFYKSQKINTVVMAASFRNTQQIEALAGCDRLTISPVLLDELQSTTGDLVSVLTEPTMLTPLPELMESEFRWGFNEDAMSVEKLAEGIRLFSRDQIALEQLIQQF